MTSPFDRLRNCALLPQGLRREMRLRFLWNGMVCRVLSLSEREVKKPSIAGRLRDQRSEIRDQKSEIRSQKSELSFESDLSAARRLRASCHGGSSALPFSAYTSSREKFGAVLLPPDPLPTLTATYCWPSSS